MEWVERNDGQYLINRVSKTSNGKLLNIYIYKNGARYIADIYSGIDFTMELCGTEFSSIEEAKHWCEMMMIATGAV